jgi:hypothetical protein
MTNAMQFPMKIHARHVLVCLWMSGVPLPLALFSLIRMSAVLAASGILWGVGVVTSVLR